MDQNKTDLPHFSTKTKSSSALWTLRTHISGGIAHGRRAFAFLDFLLWPHDSNLTINVLLHILLSIAADSFQPAMLYIQFDNCTRENKNKYVLAFLALLVHLEIFNLYMYRLRWGFCLLVIPMRTLIRCSVALLSIYGKTQLILYQVKHSLSVLYSQVLFNVLCSSQNYTRSITEIICGSTCCKCT